MDEHYVQVDFAPSRDPISQLDRIHDLLQLGMIDSAQATAMTLAAGTDEGVVEEEEEVDDGVERKDGHNYATHMDTSPALMSPADQALERYNIGQDPWALRAAGYISNEECARRLNVSMEPVPPPAPDPFDRRPRHPGDSPPQDPGSLGAGFTTDVHHRE